MSACEFHSKACLAENQALERISAAVENAFQAGLALVRLKSLVKHGDWGTTLEKKCPQISQRTAARYMRLAAEYRDRPDQLPQQPLRELYSSTQPRAGSTLGKKNEDRARATQRRSSGHAREINRLKAFLSADNRASIVAEMNSSDRREVIRLLRDLIELLSKSPH